MEWHEAAENLQRRKFGWLSPAGVLIACDLHAHLDAIRAEGLYPGAFSEIDDIASAAEDTRAVCQAAEDAGEHPAWHYYELHDMDLRGARAELVDRMYGDGWVRLGILPRRGREAICAEGTARGLAAQRRTLDDLGICLDSPVAREPVDNQQSVPRPPARLFAAQGGAPTQDAPPPVRRPPSRPPLLGRR